MGFNLQGFAQGFSQSVANTAGLVLTDQVQALRDQRMAQFQQQRDVEQRGFLTSEREAGQEWEGEQNVQSLKNTLIAQGQKTQMDYATRQAKRGEDIEDYKTKQNIKGAVNPDATPAETQANKFLELWDEEGIKTLTALQQEDKIAKGLEFDLQNLGKVLNYLESSGGTGKIPKALAIGDKWIGLAGKDKAAAMEILESSILPAVLNETMKLKGAISNLEITMIKEAKANYGNTMKANKVIYDTAVKVQQASINNYKSALAYAHKNKNLRMWETPTYTGVYGSSNAQESTQPTPQNTPASTPGSTTGSHMDEFLKWRQGQ